jgi:glycosyltransferase involved in cell wall biosynthesis
VRVLWLKTELLHPVDKGGKIRTYQMLKELKREHHITYLTLDNGAAAPDAHLLAREYCHELIGLWREPRPKFSPGFYADLVMNLASPLPYFMTKYRSLSMERQIVERVANGFFDVVVCDSLMPSINMTHDLQCPTVLFQHNVEAMIWKRHYEATTNPLKKAYLYGQWLKTRTYERAACRRFDAVVAVSLQDRETMAREYGIEEVVDVPTGVDTTYFRPKGESTNPFNLVFTGSMDWLPNEDAIRYFTQRIFPIVKRTIPGVTLTVVGRNPNPGLVELSKRDPSIVVTGSVEDVRPYMERAAAYVVPLRIGGGTRLKIYEAMAMEKPIVSTTVGAEGLPLRDGCDLLLADTPEDFAEKVVRVISNESYARELGARGGATVREHFGWRPVAESFADICRQTIQRSRFKRTPSQTAQRLRAAV